MPVHRQKQTELHIVVEHIGEDDAQADYYSVAEGYRVEVHDVGTAVVHHPNGDTTAYELGEWSIISLEESEAVPQFFTMDGRHA